MSFLQGDILNVESLYEKKFDYIECGGVLHHMKHPEEGLKRLTNILNDERGQWILSNNHDGRHNEYPVSGIVNNRLIKRVMDRTFLDKDGVRWIIDYKTSRHEGTNLDTFLDQEKHRYQSKLEDYAALMEGFGERNIKLGLYFPLLRGWREWEYKH